MTSHPVCLPTLPYLREAEAIYTPTNGSGAVHIGFPMKEAVWRTNHGYDPVIRAHYEWSQAPSSWSMQRYMFIHDALVDYEQAGVKIGWYQVRPPPPVC